MLTVAVALLAGCGKTVILQHRAEQEIGKLVYSHTGFQPKDVRCPSGVESKVGKTFECHFRGPEGPYIAYLRITAVHGTRVDYYPRTFRA
jgi:hypothetical protein